MESSEARGLARGSRNATVPLEPGVADALAECEEKIESALDTAWHALRKIHDDNLFKVAGYKTFEKYCESRWGYSKTHAYRLIDYSKLVDHLKSEGIEDIPSEGVLRPVMQMRRSSKDENHFLQRAVEAVQIVNDTAPKVFDVPQVTAQHVESTLSQYNLYRPTKRQNSSEAATHLRDLLTKIGQSDAMKMEPEVFVKRFDLKGFPSNFPRIVDWLVKCQEITGVRD